MTSREAAETGETRIGCQFLFKREEEPEKHSARSRNHGEQDQSSWQWIAGSIDNADKERTAKRTSSCARDRLFGCLSTRASVIGLPKAPDTEFKRQNYGARCRSNGGKCSSARPWISMIPPGAALGNTNGTRRGLEYYEPSSPNVTCIGRVKLKRREAGKQKTPLASSLRHPGPGSAPCPGMLFWIKKLFAGSRTRVCEPSGSSSVSGCPAERDAGASCLQLKRFTSGRQTEEFGNAVSEMCGEGSEIRQRNEGGKISENRGSNNSPASSEDGESGEPIVPHSGSLVPNICIIDEPLPVPRGPKGSPSEINLWKRRSIAPIKALDIGNPSGLEYGKPTIA